MATMEEVLAKYEKDLERFKVEFTNEFVARVKQKTPVDTGKLQNGWEGSIKHDAIEVTNSVEYASYVEFGTEKERPVGMLRTTELEAQQITDEAMKKVKGGA